MSPSTVSLPLMKAPVGSRSPSSRLWKVSAFAVSVQSASPPSSAAAPAVVDPDRALVLDDEPDRPVDPGAAELRVQGPDGGVDDLAHVISPRCGREALDFW